MLMFLHICSLVLQFVSNKILCSVYFFSLRFSFQYCRICAAQKSMNKQMKISIYLFILIPQLNSQLFSPIFLSFFFFFMLQPSSCHDKKFNAWLRNHIMQSFITQKPKSRTNREKFPYMPSLA